MDLWFTIVVSLSISVLLSALLKLTISKPTKPIPPGASIFPIFDNFLFLLKSFHDLEKILRSLHAKLGPIVTLHIGSRPAIFVADRFLTHQALVQNGSVFADRPPALGAFAKIDSSNQHNISSAFYGQTWRLLRRNLTSEILHPSRVKSYSHARKWVLEILMVRLKSESLKTNGVVRRVVDHFQYAMFCLLVLMCFGDKLEEDQIKKIEESQRRLLVNFTRFSILDFWSTVTKILFRKRWKEFLEIRRNQENVLLPFIREREKKAKDERFNKEGYVLSYVDTLFDIELPDEKRKLNEDEMVTLCNEFLDGGTDTTSTALQWIMANMVKYPHVQEKLYMEIKGVVGDGDGEEVKEDDLQRMPYLKAVILEGLRRHPPGHFLLPHAVTEDVVLGNYVVPKEGTINFMVAEMGWDPTVWEDPMLFKPERFMNGKGEVFDITGSREIKMMPFGAGRRMCPGYGLAMLHLEYFVANLVWNFEWKAVEGDDVDLSEKQEFTVVMKNPLNAHISIRRK